MGSPAGGRATGSWRLTRWGKRASRPRRCGTGRVTRASMPASGTSRGSVVNNSQDRRDPTRLLVPAVALLAVLLAYLGRVEGGDKGSPLEEQIRKQAEEAPLALRFRGTTADECRAWQQTFAAKLREVLGPHRPPDTWKVVVERVVDRGDHRREELLLTAEGHPPLPVYLLLPKEAKGPLPGVVAVHGHGALGYDPVVGRELTPGVAAA